MEPNDIERAVLSSVIMVCLLYVIAVSAEATPVYEHPRTQAQFVQERLSVNIVPSIGIDVGQDVQAYCAAVAAQNALELAGIEEQAQQGNCLLQTPVEYTNAQTQLVGVVADNQHPAHLRGQPLNGALVFEYCDSQTRTTTGYTYQPTQSNLQAGNNRIEVRCFTPDTYAVGARWVNLSLNVTAHEQYYCEQGSLEGTRCKLDSVQSLHQYAIVTTVTPSFHTCPPDNRPEYTKQEGEQCIDITRLESPFNSQFRANEQNAAGEGRTLGLYVVVVSGVFTGLGALTLFARAV